MRYLAARPFLSSSVLIFSLLIAAFSARSQCAAATAGRARATAGAEGGFSELNGTKTYYEVAGSGHPLVLIHGGQMDSRMLDEQFQLFSKTYRVVRFDVRGYGKYPASKNVYASEDDLAAPAPVVARKRA